MSQPFGDHTRRLALAFWPEVSGDENFVFSPVATSFLLQELLVGSVDPPSEALAARLPELASEPERRALASSMSRTLDTWADWPVVEMAMIQHGMFLGSAAPPPHSRLGGEPPRWLKRELFRVAHPHSLYTDAVDWLSAPRTRPSRLTAHPGGADLLHVVSLIADAPWEDRFYEDDTLPRWFHRLDGTSVLVPTMSTELSTTAQWRVGSAKCLSIPLMTRGPDEEKADLALTIVRPTASMTLRELERSMDAPTLSGWLAATAQPGHEEHTVRLPRVSLSASFDVCERLEAARPLCRSRRGATVAALQHTDVDIHERGVLLRPPYVSAGRVAWAPLGVPVVIDRPFLFFVSDRVSKAILFMGRVVDPSMP